MIVHDFLGAYAISYSLFSACHVEKRDSEQMLICINDLNLNHEPSQVE
jgi:hypothetical protein